MSEPTNEFHRWWRNHRQSGFFEDLNGHAHWNIPPSAAWSCARYRGEFAASKGETFFGEVCGFRIDYAAEYAKQGLDPQPNMAIAGV